MNQLGIGLATTKENFFDKRLVYRWQHLNTSLKSCHGKIKTDFHDNKKPPKNNFPCFCVAGIVSKFCV